MEPRGEGRVAGSHDEQPADLPEDLRIQRTGDYHPPVARILQIVREHLDVDAAFVTDRAGVAQAREANGRGSYLEIPVRSADGHPAGILCLRNHANGDPIDRRHMRFLRVIADVLADCAENVAAHDEVFEHRRARIRSILDGAHGIAIVFQPIVHLGTGAVVGCEALSRFVFPPQRSPELWFKEAWAVGLGIEFEVNALERALAAAPHLPQSAFISINVSPALMLSPALHTKIPEDVAPRVVLELTEHANVTDYGLLADALRLLRRRGVRLAIDDTGAGFASLRHVLRLTPEFIKLDASITRNLDHEPRQWVLADSLLQFSGRIGASVIAEGIDNEADLKTLRDIGFSFGQGAVLARPHAPPIAGSVEVSAT